MKKRKLKLKKPFSIIIKIIFIIIVILLISYTIFLLQIKSIKKIGYSTLASKNILLKLKKEYILNVPYNKTLEEAFISKQYKEENLDSYSKIKYVNHKNIIRNINKLIDKGYSNNDISIILSHGNDDDVYEFSKRDKVKYLEEFYTIDYAKINLYDRYLEYSKKTGEDEYNTVLFVTLGMDKEPYTNPNIVDKFSKDMLVNKYNKLNKDFVPDDLVYFSKDSSPDNDRASKILVDAFNEMNKDIEKEELKLLINSAYRSYEDQEDICKYYYKLYGENYVKRAVSYPGYSEHQTGLAIDIKSPSSNIFKNSKEFLWLQDNAYKYGFILRYGKDNSNITGYKYEPWHYRYVGKKVAKYIYENDITLEEYYLKFLLK